jgi:hypothetical protein
MSIKNDRFIIDKRDLKVTERKTKMDWSGFIQKSSSVV